MEKLSSFPIGNKNEEFSKYFIGESYLCPLSLSLIPTFNVTFTPSCRNNWHIHQAEKGGGQLLICIYGEGWYQEWGKEAVKLKAGDVVSIKANVKHWHGATKDSYFQHIAQEIPGEKTKTVWLEEVTDEEYLQLKESESL